MITPLPSDRVKELTDEFRARASLVGVFDPFDLINVGRDEKTETALLNSLAEEVDEVVIEDRILWRLKEGARHRELSRALARPDLPDLLAKAMPHPEDRFGWQLLNLLRGAEPVDFGTLEPADLLANAMAQDFVNHAKGIPRPSGDKDPRWTLARIDERKRLDHVAPKLVGRKTQLRALQRYALHGEIAAPLEVLDAPAA